MNIYLYLLDKLKRRQTLIYLPLIESSIKLNNSSISWNFICHDIYPPNNKYDIAPIGRAGVANIPGSQASHGHTLAAPAATEVSGAEPEASRLTSASPVIWLSRTSHNFGEVLVGDNEYWILTLHNEGENEGIVSDISGLPLGGFSLLELPALPFTIPPHGSRILTVKYAPDLAEHPEVACLSITTNDPNFTIQKVLLTGTGVNAPRNQVGCYVDKGTN
jgi:hypothetical protein